DLAIMRSLPEMTVIAPGDPVETKLATRAVIELDGPAYIRLGQAGEPEGAHSEPEFTTGRAITLREGSDMCLISTGAMLQTAVAAADQLAARGVGVQVLSMHTVSPLDVEAVTAAAMHARFVVTLEEH